LKSGRLVRGEADLLHVANIHAGQVEGKGLAHALRELAANPDHRSSKTSSFVFCPLQRRCNDKFVPTRRTARPGRLSRIPV
jgi:hypothetical protein